MHPCQHVQSCCTASRSRSSYSSCLSAVTCSSVWSTEASGNLTCKHIAVSCNTELFATLSVSESYVPFLCTLGRVQCLHSAHTVDAPQQHHPACKLLGPLWFFLCRRGNCTACCTGLAWHDLRAVGAVPIQHVHACHMYNIQPASKGHHVQPIWYAIWLPWPVHCQAKTVWH